MSWRFNPPPGWPEQPPGWRPPPGWAPDPAWPPAPAGWRFWLPAVPGTGRDAAGHPAAPTAPDAGQDHATDHARDHAPHHARSPAPHPTAGAAAHPERAWHQQWWAPTGTVLAVLLVGCLIGSVAALATDPGRSGSPDPPAASAPGGAPTATPPGATGTTPPEGPDDRVGPGQELTGEGPVTVPLRLPRDGLHTVTLSYQGDGPFRAELVDRDGEFVAPLGVGASGSSGTYPLELGVVGGPVAGVEIVEGEGRWTLRVRDIAEAPMWPQQTEGTGPSVLRVDPAALDGGTPVTGSHGGAGNFIVWAFPDDGGQFGGWLVFNEIGEFSGSSNLSTDVFGEPVVIVVQADGAWSITGR